MAKIIDWIRDYSYLFNAGTTMYFFKNPPKHYLNYTEKGKNPIIILPGILGKWSFMKSLTDKLSLSGYPVYVVPKLRNNLFNIPLSAKLVRDLIEENKIENAIIVAHSKGGLIGKYLLNFENRDKKVLGMVSIAAPFSGSSIVKLIPHKSFLELLPDSYIIKKLKEKSEVNKKIISIIPAFDNHIWSDSGSYLDGALENVTVSSKGHHKIIFDKGLKDIIIKSINKITKI